MVFVNLLPPEIGQRKRVRRQSVATGGALFLFVALLAGLFTLKQAQVETVREGRDTAQADLVRLEGERGQLDGARALEEEFQTRDALLAAAMTDEISWSRVLNDVSLAIPSDASLLTVTASTQGTANGTAGAQTSQSSTPAATGGENGELQFSGYSIQRFAPGVQQVLIKVDDASTVRDAALMTATAESRGTTSVTTFSAQAALDDEAFTRRYDEGLPQEVLP